MAVTANLYDNFVQDCLRNIIKMPTDVFRAVLVNGYTFDAEHTQFSQITNRIPEENGYASFPLQNVVLTSTSGVTRWSADDIQWVANGGDFGPFTGLVIYSDTSVNDKLVMYVDFDTSDSIEDGTSLVIPFGVDGIVSIE